MDEGRSTDVCEEVLLAYFADQAERYNSSTLWSQYSRLKGSLKAYDNKSKVLRREEMLKFFKEAPDEKFLMMKVVVAFGVAGACRSEEMHKLQITNIQEEGNVLVVTLPHTKPHQKRVFTVLSEGCVNGVELYRKYAALRPSKVTYSMYF
ncbi:hypothetical protein Zmor_008386 [Zophobas morio]|uniref:Uncharacterized protein n=1 Tax=Zophobas morio TaxID=2755281 RepID=A0AA38IUT9_9CUCU|nr:hypothetical protein Zmor_008386 [Zophobas morio]